MQTDHSAQPREEKRAVLFELCGEAYAIALEAVEEVIRVGDISRVPQSPAFVEGVINLRGFVIPVVDLARRFGVGSVERTRSARIMVTAVEDQFVGALVDRVLDALTLDASDIEPPSRLLRSAIRADYLLGFFESGGSLVKLLDFDKVFSIEEIGALSEMRQGADQASGSWEREGDKA